MKFQDCRRISTNYIISNLANNQDVPGLAVCVTPRILTFLLQTIRDRLLGTGQNGPVGTADRMLECMGLRTG